MPRNPQPVDVHGGSAAIDERGKSSYGTALKVGAIGDIYRLPAFLLHVVYFVRYQVLDVPLGECLGERE